MATAAQFRKLALALPDTVEGFHVDHPDFRVRGKIFAGLTKDEKGASMKLSLPTQHAMSSADREAFIPAAGAWGRAGWTMVRLSSVAAGVLDELVRESWELVALSARRTKKSAAATKKAGAKKRAAGSKRAAKKAAKRRTKKAVPAAKSAGASAGKVSKRRATKR